MPLEICWVVSASTSAFYAAQLIAAEELPPEHPLFQPLLEPAQSLQQVIERLPWASDPWSHLLPLSAQIDGNRELAECCLAKACGSDSSSADRIDLLAAACTFVEHSMIAAVPQALDELTARGGPIREHWEARGPGMMAAIGKLTEPDLIAERAQVVLVLPLRGGGGEAYLPYNLVQFEAVLANSLPQLPEVVRLGWLLATLMCDLPKYQGLLHRDRVRQLAPAALLPAALAAGEFVELTTCDVQTLRLACQNWRLSPALNLSDEASIQSLWRWWETYLQSRPRWEIALAALDRMLPGGAQP